MNEKESELGEEKNSSDSNNKKSGEIKSRGEKTKEIENEME